MRYLHPPHPVVNQAALVSLNSYCKKDITDYQWVVCTLDYNMECFREMEDWCEENCTDFECVAGFTFFKTENEALLFYMRFR